MITKTEQPNKAVNINGKFFRECISEKRVSYPFEFSNGKCIKVSTTHPAIKVATGKGWRRATPSQINMYLSHQPK